MSEKFTLVVAQIEEVELPKGVINLYTEVLDEGHAVKEASAQKLSVATQDDKHIMTIFDEAGNVIFEQKFIKVEGEFVPIRQK